MGFFTLSDYLKHHETAYQIVFIMSIVVCSLQIFTNSTGNALLQAALAVLLLVNTSYGNDLLTLSVLLDQHFGIKIVSTMHGPTLST